MSGIQIQPDGSATSVTVTDTLTILSTVEWAKRVCQGQASSTVMTVQPPNGDWQETVVGTVIARLNDVAASEKHLEGAQSFDRRNRVASRRRMAMFTSNASLMRFDM